MIEPPQPADLVGTTLAVITRRRTGAARSPVTAQVTNQGSGSSPQTIALLSLTPQGLTYGDSTTVGIGTITVPPLGPYQTYNIVLNITFPAVEPLAITNYTNFGLTMTQDANYVTNDLYPNSPDQGVGLRPDRDDDHDQLDLDGHHRPAARPGRLVGPGARPAPSAGARSFPVSTDVQNLGQGDAGPFQVFFLLTGQAGSINDAIYLGQTTITGLAAGASQPITQTLTLPTRLPSGRHPQQRRLWPDRHDRRPRQLHQRVAQEQRRDDLGPVHRPAARQRHHRADPAAAGTLPSIESVAQQDQAAAKAAAALKQRGQGPRRTVAAAGRPRNSTATRRPNTNSIVDKGVSLATEITKLPHQIESVISKSV